MGASDFSVVSKGKTAKEAFNNAVDDARHESGHGGYTGTIGEKSAFTVLSVPMGKDPRAYANELADAGDRRYEDKWGPALCVKLSDDTFLFFGIASS